MKQLLMGVGLLTVVGCVSTEQIPPKCPDCPVCKVMTEDQILSRCAEILEEDK